MAQKFTRVPTDTFEKLQLNAGILVDTFDPSTGEFGNILGATTGGINFTTNPSYTDFGEDIDNIPNNMMELKHLEQYDPQMSGTFLTCSPEVAKSLVGSADIDKENSIKVIPRAELLVSDFDEVWWIGDYSNVNTGENAGFIAVRLMNALNTAGFQIQSEKNNKGKLSFEYHGHYSIEDQDTVPFEIYVKSPNATPPVGEPSVELSDATASIAVEGTHTLTATVMPHGTEVAWSSSNDEVATVADGVVTGVTEGEAVITATITVDGQDYSDTCTVTVTAAGA